jgi:hypothetical protein
MMISIEFGAGDKNAPQAGALNVGARMDWNPHIPPLFFIIHNS